MLVVDIGNSRIKWAWWHNQQLSEMHAAEYAAEENLAGTLDQHWQSVREQLLSDEHAIWVACVAGEVVEKSLQTWLQTHCEQTADFLHSTKTRAGVTNTYTKPEQYGVDRWAALLGAKALYADSPVCVIDCGTAVTVDCMDAKGQHLGGYIMPGLDMMRSALLHNTNGIADTQGSEVELADNTADAVSSGTLRMLRAACQDACSSAEQQLGETVKIIITGGLSERVISLLGSTELCHEPALVLHGLVAARD